MKKKLTLAVKMVIYGLLVIIVFGIFWIVIDGITLEVFCSLFTVSAILLLFKSEKINTFGIYFFILAWQIAFYDTIAQMVISFNVMHNTHVWEVTIRLLISIVYGIIIPLIFSLVIFIISACRGLLQYYIKYKWIFLHIGIVVVDIILFGLFIARLHEEPMPW
jgi:hypothetical protein